VLSRQQPQNEKNEQEFEEKRERINTDAALRLGKKKADILEPIAASLKSKGV